MNLESEITKGRKEIIAEGYEMSVGELANLYGDKEILIRPDFQRLFRWDISQKTRFIESLLLGIPIPPIFVYQDENGVWELIDGLQRLSSIFEFMGILRDPDDEVYTSSILEGTRFLPSLANRTWNDSGDTIGVGKSQQLQIKRARIRVEILKQESDPHAKYELFQRLNTGGTKLSEQEVRNCVAIMLDKDFYKFLSTCADFEPFMCTIDQTEYALSKQSHMELALRFFAFYLIRYENGLDVHEYLDNALYSLATSDDIDWDEETDVFKRTFSVLNKALGNQVFKKWNGNDFSGKFLMSVFEVVATGLAKNIDDVEKLDSAAQDEFIRERCKELWENETFLSNSGAGIRGTTRLAKLLPLAESIFNGHG